MATKTAGSWTAEEVHEKNKKLWHDNTERMLFHKDSHTHAVLNNDTVSRDAHWHDYFALKTLREKIFATLPGHHQQGLRTQEETMEQNWPKNEWDDKNKVYQDLDPSAEVTEQMDTRPG